MIKNEILNEVDKLIEAYDLLVKGIDDKANENGDRAYGGIIRAGKGLLVESMAKRIVEIAWKDFGENEERLLFSSKAVKIPINKKCNY